MGDNPLGRKVAVPAGYSPDALHPLPRERVDNAGCTMYGLDHWRAYELSWLDATGRPAVFVGEFIFPLESPHLVESKSLKLYLAGLNGLRFAGAAQAGQRIAGDLSACCGAEVDVRIWDLRSYPDDCRLADYALIDHHPAPTGKAGAGPDAEQLRPDAGLPRPDAGLLRPDLGLLRPDAGLLRTGAGRVDERRLRSELFRSLCPVTGQPDWASVALAYSGAEIDEAALLSYLCGYRQHAAWHESCAEAVFHDIMSACKPESLSLSLHFLRRGGLEINVYRSTKPVTPDQRMGRDARQ